MSYARARLWLGICGVGTITVLCLLLLIFRAPERWLFVGQQSLSAEVWQLALVFLAYTAISAPFDIFGGHILPLEYGRNLREFPAFVRFWFQGAFVQGVFLTGISLIALQAARLGGLPLLVGAFTGVSVLLLAGQALVATLISGVRYGKTAGDTPESNSLSAVTASGDSSYFTGGIAGIPGLERIILPEKWNIAFSRQERDVIVLRRRELVRSGCRTRGVALAILWNLAGYTLAGMLTQTLSGVPLSSVAGVVTCSLWFTIWNFIGLLALPSPSQRGAFCGDAFTVRRGAEVHQLTGVIEQLDRMQDDEYARPKVVETYFHPIPSVERRLARLNSDTSPEIGAWNAARMAIYLSWAGGSFLSRAVHCNSGRPDVWVFLPCD